MTGDQDTSGQQGDDLGWLPEQPPATPTLEQQLAAEQWEEFTQLAAGLLVVNAPEASNLPPGWRPWVLAVMVLAAA